MLLNLEVLSLAHNLAAHATARQTVVATNIANADTPNYAAKDVTPFVAAFNNSEDTFAAKATRATHFRGEIVSASNGLGTLSESGEMAPNGNSVSLEREMMRAVEIRHQYDLALGIYRKSMDILRVSLGR